MKRVVICLIIATMSLLMFACGNTEDSDNKKDNDKKIDVAAPADKAKDVVVITAGDRNVYLDEVRYYLYNTQATYEAVYMAEDKEVDWEQIVEGDIVLKDAVKSTVIDKICKREAILSYADAYDVKLSDSELEEIDKKVQIFFDESDDELLRRIDVSPERLQEIYKKDALCELIISRMDSEEQGKADKMYKQWKQDSVVETTGYWDKLSFDISILY